MAGIWVLAEDYKHCLELLNAGQKLAETLDKQLAVFLMQKPDRADDFIAHGADRVYLLPALPEDQTMEAYIPLIAGIAKQEQPDIFFIGASLRCKEMAARIAASLNTGLCSDCTGFTLDEESQSLVMERLIFGGAAVQKVICETLPQMATIPAGAFEAGTALSGRDGQVIELSPAPPSPVKLIAKKSNARQTTNLAEARVVICVGRGLEKEADLEMARELAELLGAEIGCTRPISEELHWMPEETCIGLSGIKVKPELYIGLGVSGQIQHLTGINEARVICAINCDENAPIFDVSNYGIVGDVYKVVPQLIAELKQALHK
ncbi:MAG: electron transfer flavoprotein subunit alpha/FixB family protein [Syntrophomonadaceae bacterium]|nr:electron transfer flavoprotein subunit alpha/FixB family protein [Syntrophomonadaceae bacterium]